jgi:thioredoxin-dependent peroxiredoxin
MIEPSKATKGRRMSKKTQKKTVKKSSKTSAGKAARVRSVAAAKKPAAKKRAKPTTKSASKSPAGTGKQPKTVLNKTVSNKTAANKTATTVAKQAAVKSAAPKASHRDPSKPLKSQASASASGPKSALGTVTPESETVAAAKPKAAALKSAKTAVEEIGTEKTVALKPSPETFDAPTGGHVALAEGMKAPGFRLPRDGGETVSLADFAGRKLVLFFYPRANTPGCTKEAIDFTRLAGAFGESQTAVLGVSADPPKAQEAFRDKHELTVPLVSDETHTMLQSYGAWGEKSMYGRTFLGILRTTVLIGTDSRIIRIWRHVKVDGHADDVLAAAKAT